MKKFLLGVLSLFTCCAAFAVETKTITGVEISGGYGCQFSVPATYKGYEATVSLSFVGHYKVTFDGMTSYSDSTLPGTLYTPNGTNLGSGNSFTINSLESGTYGAVAKDVLSGDGMFTLLSCSLNTATMIVYIPDSGGGGTTSSEGTNVNVNVTSGDCQEAITAILKTLYEETSELSKMINDNSLSIVDLQWKDSELEQKISDLETDLQTQKKRLEQQEEEYKAGDEALKLSQDTQIKSLKVLIEENSALIADQQKKDSELEQKIQSVQTDLQTQMKAYLAQLQQEYQNGDDAVKAALEAEIKSLEETVAMDLDTVKARLQQDEEAIKARLTELQAGSMLDVHLTDLQKKLTTEKNELLSTIQFRDQSDLASLQEKRGTYIAELDAKKQTISADYQKRIDACDSNASDYDTQVKVLETARDAELAECETEYQKKILELDSQIAELTEPSTKPDECSTWIKYCQEAGRTEDMLFLTKETFNYLDFGSKRGGGGGQIENLVNLYLEIVNMGKDKRNSGGGNDEYWQAAVKQLLRNSMTVLKMAGEPINIINIHKQIVAASAIGSSAQEASNYCMDLMDMCIPKELRKERDFEIARSYFYEEFAHLDERTKTNTVSSFSVTADTMQRGELARCFSAEHSSLDLDSLYRDGKILIVDYSVKEWGRMGQYAAGIIKYCFQTMIEQRPDISDLNALPVFLWADECQFFSIENDQKFQTTARSSRTLTVYATQNQGNLYDGYGKEKASSLIGNLGTKFFCQNGEYETNEWASKSIGQEIILRKNISYGDSKSSSMKGDDNKSFSFSEGYSEQKDYRIDPADFSTLQTGGPRGQCKVGFVFWQSGRILNNGSVFIRSTIEQQCRRVCGAKLVRHCPHVPSLNANKAAYVGILRIMQPRDWLAIAGTIFFGLTSATGVFLFYFEEYDQVYFYFNQSIFISLATAFLYTICLFFNSFLALLGRLPGILRCWITKTPRPPQAENQLFWRDIIIAWLMISVIFTLWFQYSLGGTAEEMGICALSWMGFTMLCRWLWITGSKNRGQKNANR